MHVLLTIDINGHPHDVHTRELTGAQIKALDHHEHGTLYRLEGEHRHQIEDDQLVHLRDHELFLVEHEHHVAIHFTVDEEHVVAHQRVLTGSQIKALAHRPAGNTLYCVHDGQRIKIVDDENVHVKEGECFVTMPPVGQAS
jgi:hypothetical protein